MSHKQDSLEQAIGRVRAFNEERDWDQFHSPKELAIGLVTESSELLELFRFKSDEEILKILESQNEDVSDELADVFYFLLRFSQRFNFDLLKCLEAKMKKNAQKYPVGKSKGKNLKYNQLNN